MNIDVIIPTYNTARFIEEAINSVQSQTYKPKQIIVIDDGSIDETGRIVAGLKGTSHIPIVYIKKKNGGPNSARNLGLTQTSAEFVAFLDADDRWNPYKLEQQIKLFAEDTEGTLGLVYGTYTIIDTNGNVRSDIPTVPLNSDMRGYVFEKLLPGNLILGSASNVLIRRSVFETVGPFDETLRVGEDWDMWLRIAEKFCIDYVNEVTVAIRRHSSNNTSNLAYLIKGDIAFIEKWIPRIQNSYTIPPLWTDRLTFNMIRGLPSISMITLVRRTLSPKSRRALFARTGGSLTLACITFLARAFTNKDMRSRMAATLKRYARH